MNRFISAKPLLATALAFGALVATSAAQARTDVAVSIGVPFGYVQPQPVYVQPRPVYVQPQPVYVQPQPVYYGYGYRDRDYHHRHWQGERRGWGDADRDGVPNRFDHAPNNPWRR